MLDKVKISELPQATVVGSDDLVLVSQKAGATFTSVAVKNSNMTPNLGDMPSMSGSWNSVFSTVGTMSAYWEESADITALRNDIGASSGNWNSAFTTVGANSGLWNDTRTTLGTSSGNWNDARTTLGSSSGNWQDVRTTVASQSAVWALSGTSTDISDLASASGDWNDTRTTVANNSGSWATSGGTFTDLGDIPATSGNWNSVYTTVGSNSGNWSSAYATLGISSGDWQDVRTTVASQSAVWALSGGGGGWTGYYRNMYIDASSMVSNVTSGAVAGTDEATTNREMTDYFIFDASVHQAVQFKCTMPDEWDRDVVKMKFAWEAVTGSGDVVWGVKAVSIGNDEAIDTAWGVAVTGADTYTNPARVEISPASSAITVGNTPALGDVVYFYVYRDADNPSDTFTQSSKLLGVQLQYKEGTSAPSLW